MRFFIETLEPLPRKHPGGRPTKRTPELSLNVRDVEQVRLDALIPSPTNPRRHSDSNVAKIARSIETYGWTTPVLITDAMDVIAGHGRLLAAQKLGLEEVPCIRLSHLTPQLVEAYRIADNRLALDSDWDEELLAAAIKSLHTDPEFDVALTGFEPEEIDDFMGFGDEQPGEDETPGMQEVAVSRVGDIWQMNGHRLVCGDCTDAGVVAALLNGATLDLIVTSPPYNQSIEKFHPSGMHKEGDWVSKVERLAYDDSMPELDYQQWQLNLLSVWYDSIRDGGSVFYNHKNRYRDKRVVSPLGWLPGPFCLRQEIVWSRHGCVTQNARMFLPSDERIFWLYKGEDFLFNDSTEIKSWSTVWDINPANNQDHAVAFPVEIPRRCICACSTSGDVVMDPFCGSGTSIIAAQETGRLCYGIDQSPHCVDVAVRRWQAFTGAIARLAATNQTFEDVAHARATS